MRVILLKDVKKKGKKGDIITVKDGYGNYLINNKLGVLETSVSKKILSIQKVNERDRKLLEEENALKLKEKLEKITLNFKVNVGKGDQVFGSVSSKQIALKLKKKGIDIDKRKINIDGAINTLGVSKVEVNLHKNVKAILNINLEK